MLRLGVLAAASTTLGESTYELRLAFLLLRSPFGLVPFVPFICDDPFGDPPRRSPRLYPQRRPRWRAARCRRP